MSPTPPTANQRDRRFAAVIGDRRGRAPALPECRPGYALPPVCAATATTLLELLERFGVLVNANAVFKDGLLSLDELRSLVDGDELRADLLSCEPQTVCLYAQRDSRPLVAVVVHSATALPDFPPYAIRVAGWLLALDPSR